METRPSTPSTRRTTFGMSWPSASLLGAALVRSERGKGVDIADDADDRVRTVDHGDGSDAFVDEGVDDLGHVRVFLDGDGMHPGALEREGRPSMRSLNLKAKLVKRRAFGCRSFRTYRLRLRNARA